MLQGFHGSGAQKRGANKAKADRLELAWRQLRSRVTGPEAVAVSRDDGEAGDLRIPDEVVDLGALAIGHSVIGWAHGCISVLRPGFLGQSRGQVLRIASPIERAFRIAPDLPGGGRLAQLIL